MKLFVSLLLVAISGLAYSGPRSIKAEPFDLIVSIEKKDYPLSLSAYGHLECYTWSCPLGFCDGKDVRTDLRGIEVTQIGETLDSVSYSLKYTDSQELKNPYSRNSECLASLTIEATDHRYVGPYRAGSTLNKGSQAWAKFETPHFRDFEELHNMTFKHYYSLERYNEGKHCWGTPKLCQKFLYLVPMNPVTKLKFESITGGTEAIFSPEE